MSLSLALRFTTYENINAIYQIRHVPGGPIRTSRDTPIMVPSTLLRTNDIGYVRSSLYA